tara:strand:- start:479 stop:721 length:243 start_codon:yes stop_codon:yes gene_type:complete
VQIGDLFWVSQAMRQNYGSTMILLEISNGKGKFWTQNRKTIQQILSLATKVNYNLPQYHGGDPDYWEKLHDALDKRLGGV